MSDKRPNILIIGGGFGGLFTALDLNGAGHVTLINDEDHFLFKPMLYEYLSGEVEAWHIAPDCKELLDNDATFIKGQVTSINPVPSRQWQRIPRNRPPAASLLELVT